MSHTQRSLKNLKFAYISAFIIIIALALSAQVVIQLALHQEAVSRQVSSLYTRQSIRSQRMLYNTVLLIGNADHHASDKQLAIDLAAMEADAAYSTRNYSDFNSQVGASVLQKARAAYLSVTSAAHTLIAQEKMRYPSNTARIQAELPAISQLFYTEPTQLAFIQQFQATVDASTDAYISRISLVEYLLCSLTALVLMGEAVFVLRPALKQISALSMLPEKEVQYGSA